MTEQIIELLEPGQLVSDLDDDDAFRILKLWYLQDWRANSPWYTEAKIDYGFESGDQWDETEKAELEERRKLYVTMNRVKPTVDVICGMEVTNRQECIYIPRTTASPLPQFDPRTGQPIDPSADWDDAMVNEGYTEVARWMRDCCDAEDEESDAFRDTVICGMGWTLTHMDYDDDPEGEGKIDRKDPLDMGWDHTATKRNLDDSKRFHETKRDIPIEDAQAQYPDVEPGELHAAWAFETRIGEGYEHDRELARYYGNKTGEGGTDIRDKVTMVIIEWCEIRTRYEVYNPADRTTFELDAKGFKELSERAKKEGIGEITSRQVRKKSWHKAVLGNKLLERGPAACDYSSSYKAITGYRDRNRRQWYGIVRPMRDPQKWANKFFSVALEQIATSGKGIMAETGAFVDDKKAELEWAKTGNISWLKPGGLLKVKEKPQPPMLTGLADLMQLSLAGIRDVTGVNQETVGLADRDQAASLEYQRRQAGVTILAAFFDNLRRYRKEQGRVMLYFIQHYLSDGRLVRILGDMGTPKLIQLIKQPDTVKYDVIVDSAPSSPNQKEAAWMVTQQVLPMVMKMGAPAPVLLEILKSSPLPESNVQRIQRAYTRSQQEQAQKGPSLEEQQLQADVQKTQAETQGKQIDAQTKAQELGLRKYEADMNVQLQIAQLQQKQQEMAAQADQRQQDWIKFQAEMQVQAEQRSHDMQMRMMDYETRKMEVSGDAEKAASESSGNAMKGVVEAIGKGLESLGQGNMKMAESINAQSQALNEGLMQLAKAMMAPKTAQLSADGMSATVEPVRMQ